MSFCGVLNQFRIKVQELGSRLVDSTAVHGLDPLYIPMLGTSYLKLKIAQAFFKKKSKEYEFKFKQLRGLGEASMTYTADVPRKPMGFGILLALALMFLYLLVYLIFYLPRK